MVRAPAPRGRRSPAPKTTQVTLVLGSEPALVSKIVSRVMAAARRLDPQAERVDVTVGEANAALALATALAPALFPVPTVVVVSAAEKADGAITALLAQPATALPEQTFLVVVHEGGKAGAALLPALRAAAGAALTELTAVAPRRGRETREFLIAQAAAEGATISSEAVDLLTAAVGPDLGLQLAALAQVIHDAPGTELGVSEVSAAFTGVSEVAGFELSDSVWERRAPQALSQLNWGLQTGSLTGPAVTGALAASLRQLVRVATAPRGMSDAEVASLAGVREFKVRQLRAQARRWRPEELAAAVVSLARADAAVKGGLRPGETLSPEQKNLALAEWILTTAARE